MYPTQILGNIRVEHEATLICIGILMRTYNGNEQGFKCIGDFKDFAI